MTDVCQIVMPAIGHAVLARETLGKTQVLELHQVDVALGLL